MIWNPIKRYRCNKEILQACRAHAEKWHVLAEFNYAYKACGDAIDALDDWDLMTDDITKQIIEIKQKY